MERKKIGIIRPVDLVEATKRELSLEMHYFDKKKQRIVIYDKGEVNTFTQETWLKQQNDKNARPVETKYLGFGGINAIDILAPESDSKEGRLAHEKIMDFYTNHPKIACEGNPNAITQPPFVLVIFADEENKELEFMDLRHTVYGMLKDMNDDKLAEVIYYFGGTPVGKEKNTIIRELANEKDGLLKSEKEMKEFVKLFEEPAKGKSKATAIESTEKDARILANWAMNNGEIINDEGKLKYGTLFLGVTEKSCVTVNEPLPPSIVKP